VRVRRQHAGPHADPAADRHQQQHPHAGDGEDRQHDVENVFEDLPVLNHRNELNGDRLSPAVMVLAVTKSVGSKVIVE